VTKLNPGNAPDAPGGSNVLRLVEDDTAALRKFPNRGQQDAPIRFNRRERNQRSIKPGAERIPHETKLDH
jgi:hypothetical protein